VLTAEPGPSFPVDDDPGRTAAAGRRDEIARPGEAQEFALPLATPVIDPSAAWLIGFRQTRPGATAPSR
jgi:hypothetical protein